MTARELSQSLHDLEQQVHQSRTQERRRTLLFALIPLVLGAGWLLYTVLEIDMARKLEQSVQESLAGGDGLKTALGEVASDINGTSPELSENSSDPQVAAAASGLKEALIAYEKAAEPAPDRNPADRLTASMKVTEALAQQVQAVSAHAARVEHDVDRRVAEQVEAKVETEVAEVSQTYESQVEGLKKQLHNLKSAQTAANDAENEEIKQLRSQVESLKRDLNTLRGVIRESAVKVESGIDNAGKKLGGSLSEQ